ncbi:MAG: hypothetical protein WDK96_02195 [Candidatus Paceibacterota bacterium]|jgi:hypothetical protein
MKQVLKNKKVQIATVCGTVAIAGILLFQGAIPKAESKVIINSISPSQGATGTEVVVLGSGFSSSTEGIIGTQINGKIYAPGNYILIQSDVLDQPILSPDGKTLTFNVNLVSDKVKADCEASLAKIKPGSCKIQIKVVNAYGKMSLGQYFTVTSMGSKKLTYTIEKLDMPTPAIVHAVVPGQSWKGDDVMRFRVSAPATNGDTITGIIFSMATNPDALGTGFQQCSYFYPTSSPDSSLATDGTRLRMREEPSTGYWGASLGMDGGVFIWDPQPIPVGCLAFVGGFPLAPGTHKDFTVNMRMYAQNYALKADGTYTPPVEQSKTFSLMVKAQGLYHGTGGYVIDNSPENGYDSTFDYSLGYSGNQLRMSLSTLITSDPIQIIPQSIPTPAGYFPL